MLGNKVPRGLLGRGSIPTSSWLFLPHSWDPKASPSTCVPPVPRSRLGEAEALQTHDAKAGAERAFSV